MNSGKSLWILLGLCSLQLPVAAQRKSIDRFGKIVPADFTPHSPVIDSGSNAIVLCDVGSTEFEGNSKGYFTMIFKVHERILLRTRKGFDAATVKVTLYNGSGNFEEAFDDFDAGTYNLENGQIVETKLSKSALFKEKYNKEFTVVKFALPDVKEGCIIDYKYSIKSPFYNNNIRPWYFQGANPVLWSEYKVTIPPLFDYLTIRQEQASLPYAIDTSWKTRKSYGVSSNTTANSPNTFYTIVGDAQSAWWAMKDVPAFKEENFIYSPASHMAGIKFMLRFIRQSEQKKDMKIKDWSSTVDDLLKDPHFGQPLSENNTWFHDDLKTATKETSGLEKAKKIFEYIRDHFTCTNADNRELSTTLKKTYETKTGNVADINILLTAMLQEEGFEAHPVLLSTRDYGKPFDSSAILSQYNYVIAKLKIDSTFYLLDASVKRLGFGRLLQSCYNGPGRLIDKPPALVPLDADSTGEEKSTMLLIINDENKAVTGVLTSILSYPESLDIRENLSEKNKKDLIREMRKEYPAELELTNITIDSLDIYEEPILVKTECRFKFDAALVYFNPIIAGGVKNNPFMQAERHYPVELPGKIAQSHTMTMQIPRVYAVEELPKSIRIKLNENDGMFEYIIAKSDEDVQFRCRLELNKTNFQAGDYKTLRDFFAVVVKKEAEQIVFRRIK